MINIIWTLEGTFHPLPLQKPKLESLIGSKYIVKEYPLRTSRILNPSLELKWFTPTLRIGRLGNQTSGLIRKG